MHGFFFDNKRVGMKYRETECRRELVLGAELRSLSIPVTAVSSSYAALIRQSHDPGSFMAGPNSLQPPTSP
jgi:hypothetical protein